MDSPSLSILIPATPKRVVSHLQPLVAKLERQISEMPCPQEFEVLTFLDNRRRTIGEKRDALVQMSRGRRLRATSSITWRPAATAMSSRER